VPFLNNIPGVKAKRFGANAIERNTKILSLLNNILDENRTILFFFLNPIPLNL
jgi:inosine/xanthosine triphosphate pyrophosphatase family protein